MTGRGSAGRPRRSSRATLQDAAYELFLERGYDETSVDDIAQRAGVSRSTFWGYAASKSDILWLEVDTALDALEAALAGAPPDEVPGVVRGFAETLGPESAPLAFVEMETMGVRAELEASAFGRLDRLVRLLSAATGDRRRGWALAATLVAAAEEWVRSSPRHALAEHLRD